MTNFFTLDNDIMEADTKDRILFKTATEFSMFITNIANQNKATLTQTILDYCDDRDIDVEDITKLISKPLKERLAMEMQESGLMRVPNAAKLDV